MNLNNKFCHLCLQSKVSDLPVLVSVCYINRVFYCSGGRYWRIWWDMSIKLCVGSNICFNWLSHRQNTMEFFCTSVLQGGISLARNIGPQGVSHWPETLVLQVASHWPETLALQVVSHWPEILALQVVSHWQETLVLLGRISLAGNIGPARGYPIDQKRYSCKGVSHWPETLVLQGGISLARNISPARGNLIDQKYRYYKGTFHCPE